VCVDEKPMQALERRHPTHVSRDDATVRYEYVEARTPKRGISAALSAIVCLRRGQCFARLLQEDAALLMFATSRFWVIAST
jgi:hypothetical protein